MCDHLHKISIPIIRSLHDLLFFKRGILLSALNRHGFFFWFFFGFFFFLGGGGCLFITSIYNTMRGQMLLSPSQRSNLHGHFELSLSGALHKCMI